MPDIPQAIAEMDAFVRRAHAAAETGDERAAMIARFIEDETARLRALHNLIPD